MAAGLYDPPRPAHTIVRSPQAVAWQHLKGGNRITKSGILGSKTNHRNYNHIKFGEGHTITGDEARKQSKDIVALENVNWYLVLIGISYFCDNLIHCSLTSFLFQQLAFKICMVMLHHFTRRLTSGVCTAVMEIVSSQLKSL